MGLGTGTLAYGIAYERHALRLVNVTSSGHRAARRTRRPSHRAHHRHPSQRSRVRRRRVARRGAAAGEPAGPDRARRRLRLVRRPALRRAGRRAAGAARRCAPGRRSPCWAITTTIARCRPLCTQRGFSVLRDQRTSLDDQGRNGSIWPVSVSGRAGPPTWRACSRGTSGTTFLLAHDPRRLTEAAAFDVQLVLSGHTHGGQVLLPGVGAIAGRKFPVLAGTRHAKGTPRCSSAAASERSTCRSASTARPKSPC